MNSTLELPQENQILHLHCHPKKKKTNQKAEGSFWRVDKSCVIEVIWQAIIKDNSLRT